MAGGPRNHTPGRINYPPKPGGPSWNLRLFIIQRMRDDLDKFGYKQIEVDSKYAIIYVTSHGNGYVRNDPWTRNCIKEATVPDRQCGFWLSQNGCHSTVILNDKMYVLMGVVSKKNCRILKLQEASLTVQVEKWIKQCIDKATS